MSDSDHRKELLEELRRVRRRVEELERETAAGADEDAPAGPTRRDVLRGAVWVSPIILSLSLPGAADAVPAPAPTSAPTSPPTSPPTPEPTLATTTGTTTGSTTRTTTRETDPPDEDIAQTRTTDQPDEPEGDEEDVWVPEVE